MAPVSVRLSLEIYGDHGNLGGTEIQENEFQETIKESRCF